MPTLPERIAALVRLAGELEAEADGQPPERAVVLLRRALVLRSEIDELRKAAKPLPSVPKSRTLIPDMAQPALAEPRRRGRPTKSKHPFPRALEAKGSTVAEWAAANDIKREVVKSWFAPPPSGRRIPAVMAARIAKELGVPATDAVWRNGIR